MFSIVEFCNGDGVAAVPEGWVENGETLWPPFRNPSRCRSAIKNCEKPGEGWTAHKCRVLGSAATYLEAKRKEKKAEEVSYLTTDEDKAKKRVRRPTEKLLCAESEGDSGGEILKKRQRKRKAVVPVFTSDESNDSSDHHAPAAAEKPGQQMPFVACPAPRGAKSKVMPDHVENGMLGLLKNAIKVLARVEEKIDHLAESVKRLENAGQNTPAVPSASLEILQLLPLSTFEEVATLEGLLDDAENRKTLISHLALVGGSCQKDVVRQLMKRAVTDELAKDYCLTGRKGKRPFMELNFMNVIIASLRLSCPSGKEVDLKREIADHFRHAPARCKKRDLIRGVDHPADP